MRRKGIVHVQVDKGWLRLYWLFEGKKKYLYTSLPDSEVNRLFVEQKAKSIELDIISGNYDISLEKYRLVPLAKKKAEEPISSILRRFEKWKKPHLTTDRTLNNYRHAIKKLSEFYQKDVCLDDLKEPQLYINWLSKHLSYSTVRLHLSCLKSLYKYAEVDPNPWDKVTLKTQSKPKPRPFSKAEVVKLLEIAKTDKFYPLIRFLLTTGCRIGEVAGLKWESVDFGSSIITIKESYVRGENRLPKCNKIREIPINESLSDLLISIRPEKVKKSDRVFNFKYECFYLHWQHILEAAGIPYRKPHYLRSTFICHALEAGLTPLQVSQISGHDVQTMFNYYVNSVNKPSLPDLF